MILYQGFIAHGYGSVGSSPNASSRTMWHTAAAQWINQKQQRHALEQRICLQLGPQQQVAYVDCASYHETPMKSTVEQPPTTTDTPHEATFESAVFGTHENLHLTMNLSQCFKHSTHQVKMLQAKSTYVFLLKVGDGFVFLLGSTATPVQVMERGTAEVLKEHFQRNAAVSPWIQAFRWKCRASCTDKAGYN